MINLVHHHQLLLNIYCIMINYKFGSYQTLFILSLQLTKIKDILMFTFHSWDSCIYTSHKQDKRLQNGVN